MPMLVEATSVKSTARQQNQQQLKSAMSKVLTKYEHQVFIMENN